MVSKKNFNIRFVQTTLAIIASMIAVAGFVYGATTIGTNISIDGNLTVSGTNATTTFSTGGLTVGTNQFVVQQTSGNIGIGTTTPNKSLTVVGTESITFLSGSGSSPTANVALLLDGGDTMDINILTPDTKDGRIFFGRPSSPTAGRIVYSHPTDSLRLFTIATERLRIDSSGNVGIGTTTPYSRLHVSQGASATTTVNFGEVGSATSKACFNTKNTAGTDISFYFNAANSLVVESNLCR